MRQGPDGNYIVELNSDTLPKVLVNQRYHAELIQERQERQLQDVSRGKSPKTTSQKWGEFETILFPHRRWNESLYVLIDWRRTTARYPRPSRMARRRQRCCGIEGTLHLYSLLNPLVGEQTVSATSATSTLNQALLVEGAGAASMPTDSRNRCHGVLTFAALSAGMLPAAVVSVFGGEGAGRGLLQAVVAEDTGVRRPATRSFDDGVRASGGPLVRAESGR